MPDETAVDRLYQEASAVIEALQRNVDVSLQVAAADNLRKSLLLAAASNFEVKIYTLVLEFVRERSNGSVLVEKLVQNKCITRQYHTWFDWNKNNANDFFGLFGKDFSAAMKDRVKKSVLLDESIKAFMEIGSERNRLVHQDYATFPLEKDLTEIYALYKKALLFIEQLPLALRECDKTNTG